MTLKGKMTDYGTPRIPTYDQIVFFYSMRQFTGWNDAYLRAHFLNWSIDEEDLYNIEGKDYKGSFVPSKATPSSNQGVSSTVSSEGSSVSSQADSASSVSSIATSEVSSEASK